MTYDFRSLAYEIVDGVLDDLECEGIQQWQIHQASKAVFQELIKVYNLGKNKDVKGIYE